MKKIAIFITAMTLTISLNAQVANPNFASYKAWINKICNALSALDTVKASNSKTDSLNYFKQIKAIQDKYFDTALLYKQFTLDTLVFLVSAKKEFTLGSLATFHREMKKFGSQNIIYEDQYSKTNDPIEREIIFLDLDTKSKLKFYIAFDPLLSKPISSFIPFYKLDKNTTKK
jgi:hypothetical protein